MKMESIFDICKVKELEITKEEYYALSLAAQSEYVSALIRSFRENLNAHVLALEMYFKKENVVVSDLEAIEIDFGLWVDYACNLFLMFIKTEYIAEVFLDGSEWDELIEEYQKPTKEKESIPKDDLMAYAGRMKSFISIMPLKSNILTKLKTAPDLIIYHDEMDQADDEVVDSFSEGYAMVAGEKISLTYPFYNVAKYLDKKKAYSEDKAISQNKIHEELKLSFESNRLKQWKKIKGKVNPVVESVFNTNTRGFVWLKKNVKIM